MPVSVDALRPEIVAPLLGSLKVLRVTCGPIRGEVPSNSKSDFFDADAITVINCLGLCNPGPLVGP